MHQTKYDRDGVEQQRLRAHAQSELYLRRVRENTKQKSKSKQR